MLDGYPINKPTAIRKMFINKRETYLLKVRQVNHLAIVCGNWALVNIYPNIAGPTINVETQTQVLSVVFKICGRPFSPNTLSINPRNNIYISIVSSRNEVFQDFVKIQKDHMLWNNFPFSFIQVPRCSLEVYTFC